MPSTAMSSTAAHHYPQQLTISNSSNSPAAAHQQQLTSSNLPAATHQQQLTSSNSPAATHQQQHSDQTIAVARSDRHRYAWMGRLKHCSIHYLREGVGFPRERNEDVQLLDLSRWYSDLFGLERFGASRWIEA